MELLWRDIHNAFRRLSAAPVFTGFAVVTLALGIGATTAIYSAVHAAVLRPPALREADRVASLYHIDPRRGGSRPMISLSYPDFEDYRVRQTSFAALAAWTRFRQALVAGGAAEVLSGEMVGGEYFSVVGAEAALGRTIQPADQAPGAARVMVLSHALWRRVFAEDPGVVGRIVSLGGEPVEIVGVAPAWFKGVDVPNLLPTPAWIPLSPANAVDSRRLHDREDRWLRVIGRLAPGRTMEEALAEFRAIGQALDAEHPIGRNSTSRSAYVRSRQWFLLPVAGIRMHESTHAVAGPLAATVLVAVGLVLLVACTNIANLMLARGAGRRQEFAVRLALGASRWRLAREQVIEASLVIAAGALLAFVLARVLITRVLSGSVNAAPGLTVQFEPTLDLQVAMAGFAAAGVALLVFGLLPALQAGRANVRDALASDGENAASPRWRARSGLIALQVTVSAGLVAVALLCAQQLVAAARHDPGFDVDRLAVARFNFELQSMREPQVRPLLERIRAEVRRQPGITGVALASGLPTGTQNRSASLATTITLRNGRLSGQSADLLAASPEIFEVLGVSIVQGRAFDARDTAASERVVVLDGAIASRLFGGVPAVGREVHFMREPRSGEPERPIETAVVIGIAEETDVGVIGERGREGLVYLPFAQEYTGELSVMVRTAGNPAAGVETLRRTLGRVAPDLAVFEAGTGVVIARAENLMLTIGAWAATLLGGLALVLAMAGLYGVLMDLVQRRTREIGIRLALGADRSRVVRMVLRDGVRPVLIGLVLGAGIGVILRLSFRPLFLRMMPAFDPILFVLVPVPFIVAALIAAWIPARRAAAVDPNVALRHL